jgi:hypothetical protein
MTETIKNLKARAERAQAKFEADKATLYRGDGAPVYGDQEHKERLGALTQERNATLRQIEEDARTERATLDTKAANIKNRDAAGLLTSEELANANDRRAFAQDAAETLGVEELALRLQSVQASGDKGVIFAHLSAAERRQREIIRSRPTGTNGTVSSFATTELDGVISEMRKALDPHAEVEIESAKSAQEEAIEVELLAANLKHGARTSAGAYVNRRYDNVAERLDLRRA